MIRAIFFDFYSVWAPDKFEAYLAEAQAQNPHVALELQDVVNKYNLGLVDLAYVADSFRFKLSRPDIDTSIFKLEATDIPNTITDFMRGLHAHFVKLGVLGNLGKQEFKLLNNYNAQQQLFEVITGPIQLKTPLLSQETFVQALQAIGEPPKSCLLVSGHEDYLHFAGSLGLTALKFEGFPNLQQQLDQLLTTGS
jgi:hypothetical protein